MDIHHRICHLSSLFLFPKKECGYNTDCRGIQKRSAESAIDRCPRKNGVRCWPHIGREKYRLFRIQATLSRNPQRSADLSVRSKFHVERTLRGNFEKKWLQKYFHPEGRLCRLGRESQKEHLRKLKRFPESACGFREPFFDIKVNFEFFYSKVHHRWCFTGLQNSACIQNDVQLHG